MPKLLDYELLNRFISEEVVEPFYQKRLTNLSVVKLRTVLKRKNPYLFKAKNMATAEELVKEILNAYISSGEETVFGNYLENLAIHIAASMYDGKKSAAEGIDLEVDKDGVRYIVAIKSGPNWGNSSQILKMKDQFRKARRVLNTSNSRINVIAVNGCCYGQDNRPNKEEYLKLCGQRFWEFISGDSDLYIKLIEPLGRRAKEKDFEFEDAYSRKVNQLTKTMLEEFCERNGSIDWDELLMFNSGSSGTNKT